MSSSRPSLTALSIRDLADHRDAVPRLASWYQSAWGGDASQWQQILADRSRRDEVPFTRLAFLEDTLVGATSVCWDDSDQEFAEKGPWLSAVFVQGPARNLGVGRALLVDVEERCRELGHSELWLHTAEAERFYERCGWQVVRPRAYLGTDTVMRRLLSG